MDRTARLRRIEEAIRPTNRIFVIVERDVLAHNSTVEAEEKRLRDEEGLTDRDLLVTLTCLSKQASPTTSPDEAA